MTLIEIILREKNTPDDHLVWNLYFVDSLSILEASSIKFVLTGLNTYLHHYLFKFI